MHGNLLAAAEMVAALADSVSVSAPAAVRHLDEQAPQQQRFTTLAREGVRRDGAFFDRSSRLTVNVQDAASAEKAEEARFKVRVPQHGASASRPRWTRGPPSGCPRACPRGRWT
ncbi:hypothetical protein ACFUAG_12300 [Streptomyces sp. NPDC057193]|uniref:hypothetical protein n=1 Tax=Streptomyces sp. NPDC057193 TaxID=3346043 RepID=UPI0036292018